MPTRLRHSAHNPTAILVLGMHRSGTSAVARMLNLCGANLGRDLLPAKDDNERGFWENSAILDLHERFLADMGSSWHDLNQLPSEWRQSAAARRFVADLPRVLAEQFQDSALIAVKDPRLSLLAPLWIEVLQARAMRVACVLTIRDPDEVAASLARRDGLPVVQSQALWLQNVLDGERVTRGNARVFVHYERLLADWRIQLDRIAETLQVSWPVPSKDREGGIAEFISPSLRHWRDAGPRPDLVQRAYALACEAAAGTATPHEAFDRIAAEFAGALQIAAPLYRELSQRSAQQAEQARQSLDRKDQEIAQARANIDALAQQITVARDAHGARDQLEADLRAALGERDAEIDRARSAFALKEEEIDAARRNIDALAQEIANARKTIALKDREIETAHGNIDALLAARDELRTTLTRRDAEIDAARGNINLLDAEIDAARGNIDALVAEIGRAREAHGVRDATEAALRDELRALRQSRWFRLGRAIGLLDRNRR